MILNPCLQKIKNNYQQKNIKIRYDHYDVKENVSLYKLLYELHGIKYYDIYPWNR